MKKIKLLSIIVSLLLVISSCKKEKVCSEIPEGLYHGWFTDNGSSNSTFNPNMQVTKLNENELRINSSASSGYTIKRQGCHVEGKMGAIIGNQGKTLDITGEISRKKGHYIISGDYSYIEHSGLGDPNPQYYEVQGTFEIKSN